MSVFSEGSKRTVLFSIKHFLVLYNENIQMNVFPQRNAFHVFDYEVVCFFFCFFLFFLNK